jgi:hypothetical protein
MNQHKLSLYLGAALLTALLAGCSGSGPYDVSGTVTFRGKPVPIGLVVIEPDASQGNTGTQTQGLIQDGNYRTLSGLGAIAGPVVVTVNANDGDPKPMWPHGKLLFRTYQFKAELPHHSSTLNIEVPEDHALSEPKEEVQ